MNGSVSIVEPGDRIEPEQAARTPLSVPVCGVPGGCVGYMKFQITPAATMLIASGTKITDLATDS